MSHERSVWAGTDGRVLIAVSAGWLAVRLGREAIPPLVPTIIDEVQISPESAGFGLTVMWFVYATCQYPGGRFSDALSRKTVLTASLGTLVVGFLVLGVVSTYAGLLAGFVLVGLGGGLYFVPSRALLTDTFGDRRGQVFGIQSASGSVGAMAAAGVAVAAISVGVWQLSFLPVVVVLVGVLGGLLYWYDGPFVIGRASLGLGGTGRRILAVPRARSLLAAYICVSFVWQGFLGFLPTFLQAEKGFDPAFAGAAFASVFLVAVVVGPVAGRLGDTVSRVFVGLGGVGLAIAGLLVLVTAGSTLVAVLGVVVVAVGLRSYPPVMQAHLIGLFPDDSMAGDLGAMKMIWTGVGSFAPTYVGVVAARSSYGLAFTGFVACLAVSLVVLAVLHLTGE
ncbi:MFS transporter [Haloplanus aerogenes]|uniref:Sugar phosphate permease n=1 Tax=Haloplanus aerogenes TaxID=660522 RepID=A0A3M0DSL1_9EURY|nr:MFS transporter [Haloplanus aerogenes]RMB25031.1 sugar phosphate permease [Haloplanus aerogenes]